MSKINRRLKEILAATSPDVLAQEAYPVFVKTTPIDQGGARRNTKVSGPVIHADYAYATRLNNGWSTQAKRGMVEPTLKAIQQYIRKQV
jgi:hypothetical protein